MGIKPNLELYSNLHPNTTMKGTGFKNEKSALKTLEIIKYRSPKYQFDVINTMYNRAKYHPNQTSEMRQAMKIFKKWLGKYKKDKVKYPYLPLEEIKKLGIKSEFVNELEKVKGKYYKLQYVPIGKYDVLSYRNLMINKILSNNLPLYNKKGEPNRKYQKLLSFGYLPKN